MDVWELPDEEIESALKIVENSRPVVKWQDVHVISPQGLEQVLHKMIGKAQQLRCGRIPDKKILDELIGELTHLKNQCGTPEDLIECIAQLCEVRYGKSKESES